MRQAIPTRILAIAGVAAAMATPAAACDQHDEAAYAFLSTLELRGMSDQEVQAARAQAIAQYHARELERAKARFMRRFAAVSEVSGPAARP